MDQAVGPFVRSQPAGSVSISPPWSNIQTAINANPGATTFWLTAGTYNATSFITAKTNNIFIGQYGAIIDGTGWSSSDSSDGAFKGQNLDIDNITISNLVIQNMPQRGIQSYKDFCSGWIVEHCEIKGCHTGIDVCPGSTIRYNYIHHNVTLTPGDPDPANRGGGYFGLNSPNVLFLGNEFAYNGAEQKLSLIH